MKSLLRAIAACLVLLSCHPCGVMANDIPWRPGEVDLQASNEPLTAFVVRFLTRQRVAAVVSELVGTEAVNGRFRGRPDVIFRAIADTYGLTWYFDGAALHVSSLAENRTKLLWVDPADATRAEKLLREMRILDARYPLRASPTEGYLLVSGPPRMVELVVDAMRLMADSPGRAARASSTRVFRLKNAWADDTYINIGGYETFVPGVARTLNDMMGDASARDPRVRQLPRKLNGLRGSGLAAVGRTEAPMNPLKAESTQTDSARAPVRVDSANPEARQASTAVIVAGGAIVRAEPRINAVIVRDAPERMPMYEELIAALDTASALVEVEATVIDLSTDNARELGIDWRAHRNQIDIASSPNRLAGTGAPPRNLANDLLYTDNPVSAGAGLIGTLIFGSERSYFLARINALVESGDANLVSRPRVLTLDNNEAVLQSTQEFYIRVAGQEQVDLFNVTVGLVLRVTPTVVEEDGVRRFKLLIRIEDGNANGVVRVDQIPVVNRNSIVTQAVVGEGESLLIGGYVIDENRNSQTGVPGLSNLPVLGWFFKQDSRSVRRVERMFMITPRVVTRGTQLP